MADDTVQLNLPIPATLHRDLKMYAAKWGMTLREVVVSTLERAMELPDPESDYSKD